MPIALIAPYDKTGLRELAFGLAELGFDIYSTSGTQKFLSDAGLPVHSVATLTGFPEILDGRVKTLHPTVHGGILAALIDDALANVWFTRGAVAVTAKIEVRFRQEARPGQRLIITAEPTGSRAGLMTAKAEVRRDNGDLVADGTGFVSVKGPL